MITIEIEENNYVVVIKGNEDVPIDLVCPNCQTKQFTYKHSIEIGSGFSDTLKLKCKCGSKIFVTGKVQLLKEISL